MRILFITLLGVAALLPSASVQAAAAPRWSWPVPDPHPVVRGFEAPATAWAAGHRGIDVAAPVGTPVRAPDDGVVAFAGRVVDRGVLSIDHGGLRSSFEPVEASVPTGSAVRRGQVVAHVAMGAGHPAGVLHIGARVREGDEWAYVSPLLLLGGAEHAVLLPLAALPG